MEQLPNNINVIGQSLTGQNYVGLTGGKWYAFNTPIKDDPSRTYVRFVYLKVFDKYYTEDARLADKNPDSGYYDALRIYGDFIDAIVHDNKSLEFVQESERATHRWGTVNYDIPATIIHLDPDTKEIDDIIIPVEDSEIKTALRNKLTEYSSSGTKLSIVEKNIKQPYPKFALFGNLSVSGFDDLETFILNLKHDPVSTNKIAQRVHVVVPGRRDLFLQKVVEKLSIIKDRSKYSTEIKLEDFHKIENILRKDFSPEAKFLVGVLEHHGLPTKGESVVLGLGDSSADVETLQTVLERVHRLRDALTEIEEVKAQLNTFTSDPFSFLSAEPEYVLANGISLSSKVLKAQRLIEDLGDIDIGIKGRNNQRAKAVADGIHQFMGRYINISSTIRDVLSITKTDPNSLDRNLLAEVLRVNIHVADPNSPKDQISLPRLLDQFEFPVNINSSNLLGDTSQYLSPTISKELNFGTLQANQFKSELPNLVSTIRRSVSQPDVFNSEEIQARNEIDPIFGTAKDNPIQKDLINTIARETKSDDARKREALRDAGLEKEISRKPNQWKYRIGGKEVFGPWEDDFYKSVSEEREKHYRNANEKARSLVNKVITLDNQDYLVKELKNGEFVLEAASARLSDLGKSLFLRSSTGNLQTINKVFSESFTGDLLAEAAPTEKILSREIIDNAKIKIPRKVIPGLRGAGEVSVNPRIFTLFSDETLSTRQLQSELKDVLGEAFSDLDLGVFQRSYKNIRYHAANVASRMARSEMLQRKPGSLAHEVIGLSSQDPTSLGEQVGEDILNQYSNFYDYIAEITAAAANNDQSILRPFLSAINEASREAGSSRKIPTVLGNKLGALLYRHSQSASKYSKYEINASSLFMTNNEGKELNLLDLAIDKMSAEGGLGSRRSVGIASNRTDRIAIENLDNEKIFSRLSYNVSSIFEDMKKALKERSNQERKLDNAKRESRKVHISEAISNIDRYLQERTRELSSRFYSSNFPLNNTQRDLFEQEFTTRLLDSSFEENADRGIDYLEEVIEQVHNIVISNAKDTLSKSSITLDNLNIDMFIALHEAALQKNSPLVIDNLVDPTTNRIYGGEVAEINAETAQIVFKSGVKISLREGSQITRSAYDILANASTSRDAKRAVILPPGETNLGKLSTKIKQVPVGTRTVSLISHQENEYLDDESIDRFVKFYKKDFNNVIMLDIENDIKTGQIFALGFTSWNKDLSNDFSHETRLSAIDLLEEADRIALGLLSNRMTTVEEMTERQQLSSLYLRLHSRVKEGTLIGAHNAAHDFTHIVERSRALGLNTQADFFETIFKSHGFDTIHLGPISGKGTSSSVENLLGTFLPGRIEKHTPVSDTIDVVDIVRKMQESGLTIDPNATVLDFNPVGKIMVFPRAAETPVLVEAILPANERLGRRSLDIVGRKINPTTLEAEGPSGVQFTAAAGTQIYTGAQLASEISNGEIHFFDTTSGNEETIRALIEPKLEDNAARYIRRSLTTSGSQRQYEELRGQISSHFDTLSDNEREAFSSRMIRAIRNDQTEAEGFDLSKLTDHTRQRLIRYLDPVEGTNNIYDPYVRQSSIQASQVLIERSRGIDNPLVMLQDLWRNQNLPEVDINTRSRLYQNQIASFVKPLDRVPIQVPDRNDARYITLETGNIKDKITLSEHTTADYILGVMKTHSNRLNTLTEADEKARIFSALREIDQDYSNGDTNLRLANNANATLEELAQRVSEVANSNLSYGLNLGDRNDYGTQIIPEEQYQAYRNRINDRVRKVLGREYQEPSNTEEELQQLNNALMKLDIESASFQPRTPVLDSLELRKALNSRTKMQVPEGINTDLQDAAKQIANFANNPSYNPRKILQLFGLDSEYAIDTTAKSITEDSYTFNVKEGIGSVISPIIRGFEDAIEKTPIDAKIGIGIGIVSAILGLAAISKKTQEAFDKKKDLGEMNPTKANSVEERALEEESSEPSSEATSGWRRLKVKIDAIHSGFYNGERISDEALQALSNDVSNTLSSHLDADYDSKNSEHNISSRRLPDNRWDVAKIFSKF